MKSTLESSIKLLSTEQSSAGPRAAVNFCLIPAGRCGIANRNNHLVDGFGFLLCFPLAATKENGLLFNFRSITRCDQTSIQAHGL